MNSVRELAEQVLKARKAARRALLEAQLARDEQLALEAELHREIRERYYRDAGSSERRLLVVGTTLFDASGNDLRVDEVVKL